MLRILFLSILLFSIGLTVEQPFKAAKTENSSSEKNIIEENEEEINFREGEGVNQNGNQDSKEKIYLHSKENNLDRLVEFPRYVEKLSSFIRQKQENGEEGTYDNPIKVEWSRDVLHTIASLLKQLPYTARNHHAKTVDPQDFTDQTIFVYKWLSKRVNPLLPEENSHGNKELEQMYFAMLELNVAPLVNVLAEQMVKRLKYSEDKFEELFKEYKATKTLKEGYILMQISLLKKKQSYHSYADRFGKYGQTSSADTMELTSLKGLDLKDAEGYEKYTLGEELWRVSRKYTIGENPTVFKDFIFRLDNNEIKGPEVDPDFPSEPFKKFKNLKKLCIRDVEWTSLPENFFNGLDQLQYIEFFRTKITSFPSGLVRNLKNLKTFQLSYSLINSLPEDFFMGSNLERISLDDCQNLQDLPHNLLARLSNLKVFQLKDCPLQTLPVHFFADSKQLKRADIIKCPNLQALPSDFLNGLNQLTVVKIAECPNLLALPSDFFQNSISIKEIIIEDISYLPDDLFQGLTHLKNVDLGSTHLQVIPSLKECKHLKVLILPWNVSSTSELRKIRKELPFKTKIYKKPPPQDYFGSLYKCGLIDYILPYRYGRKNINLSDLLDDFFEKCEEHIQKI